MERKLCSCKLHIASCRATSLWANSVWGNTVGPPTGPTRITRACTSIRSVYLFNDHERNARRRPSNNYLTTLQRFREFPRVSVCLATVATSTLKLVSTPVQSLRICHEDRSRNNDGTWDRGRMACSPALPFSMIGLIFSLFDRWWESSDTNIIAFSNRIYLKHLSLKHADSNPCVITPGRDVWFNIVYKLQVLLRTISWYKISRRSNLIINNNYLVII